MAKGKYLYDNKGKPELLEVVQVNEGNLTITTGDTTRGVTKVGVFANRMQFDDETEVGERFVPDGLIRVKPYELTDTLPVVGEFSSNPRGKVPLDKNYNWGQYKPREADGRFYGKRIRMKTVVATDEIPFGSYIKPSTTELGKFVVSATATDYITFGTILANTEKLVPVLEMV
jgi:hypothetical protein